jgi:hypothetical protein
MVIYLYKIKKQQRKKTKMEKITINMIISTKDGIQLVMSNDAIISGSTDKINQAIMMYDVSDNVKYIVEQGSKRNYAPKETVCK